jgi:hypothetical protein
MCAVPPERKDKTKDQFAYMANFIKPVCLSAKMKPPSDTFGVHDADFI